MNVFFPSGHRGAQDRRRQDLDVPLQGVHGPLRPVLQRQRCSSRPASPCRPTTGPTTTCAPGRAAPDQARRRGRRASGAVARNFGGDYSFMAVTRAFGGDLYSPDGKRTLHRRASPRARRSPGGSTGASRTAPSRSTRRLQPARRCSSRGRRRFCMGYNPGDRRAHRQRAQPDRRAVGAGADAQGPGRAARRRLLPHPHRAWPRSPSTRTRRGSSRSSWRRKRPAS